MPTEEIEVAIEIVCTSLPGAGDNSLHLAIQRDETITEAAPADSKRIVFRPALRARRNADGTVNFLGPFAHGPKAERFIYLNWVAANGTVLTVQVGRIKLHLNHIKWSAAKKAAEENKPIRVGLALTNAKGGPVMASVRPDVAKWELPWMKKGPVKGPGPGRSD
jgi:Family of unknown function (DUF5990)